MKKFLYFFGLCAFILATIGGIIVALVNGLWPVALAIAFLAVLSHDKLIFFFKELSE